MVTGCDVCLMRFCSVVKKVAQYMADVLEDSRDKVQENLLANGGEQASSSSPHQVFKPFIVVVEVFLFLIFYLLLLLVDLITYITRFQWDMAKYPIKQSLKNISEIISKVSLHECVMNNVHFGGFVGVCTYGVCVCVPETCH